MSHQSRIEQRLTGYALAAGAALAAGSAAQAAVQHADLDPDLLFTLGEGPQVFALDFDGDTLVDVDLGFSTGKSTFNTLGGVRVERHSHALYAVGKSVNQVMVTSGYGRAKAFQSGHSLGSLATASLSYASGGRMGKRAYSYYSTGKADIWNARAHFNGKERRIVVAKFMSDGDWHFGWCRVSVDTNTTRLTVHDYAYEDFPGRPITPGAMYDTTLWTTVGGYAALKATDVPGTAGGVYAATPKVVAHYIDPVKGGKPKKAACQLKMSDDMTTLGVMVKKKVRLYDAKAFKAYYKLGMRARDMVPYASQGMLFDLEVTPAEAGAPPPVRCAHVSPRPPHIFGFVPPPLGADPNNPIVEGRWFGVKPPKAWVEYRVPNPKTGGAIVKTARLKVLKAFIHADAKGKPNSSCMDVFSGASQITLQLPAAWPKDFDAIDAEHDLILDNGIGLAHFRLIPPF